MKTARAARFTLAPLFTAVLLAPAASAQDPAPPERAPQRERLGVNVSLDAGFEHLFDTDIDDGGDVNATRFGAAAGLSFELNDRLNLGLNLGYAYDGYDFGGDSGFGGLDPWEDVHTVRAGARLTWKVDEQWAVYGGPVVRLSAESGADFGDAVTGGGIVGASYRASDRLSIGGGVGVVSQIEDDAAVFPILIVNWKISDALTARTVGGIGASGGGGVELGWTFAEGWELALGGRYDSRRFRLEDDGPFPDGVGEETSIPLYAKLSYTARTNASFSLLAGVAVAGELRLEDDDGDRIAEEDFDPAPFIGASVTIRF